MNELDIYKFQDSNVYVLISEVPEKSYKKYFMMTLDPGKKRVSVIFPFKIKDLSDFNQGREYSRINKDTEEYSTLRKEAKNLAEKKVKKYEDRKLKSLEKGEISEIELESATMAERMYYYDLMH